ncbi:hypothetical protein HMSSN036_07110 [Paenibacillus macerans]|nr:hypothetical protein HMSSN036_07110 [Paenibacillus macerans]
MVSEYEIETQEKLVELLAEQDVMVTQATISRDIRELNLIKIASPKGIMIYHVSSEMPLQTNLKLKRKLKEVVVRIDYVDQLTIIKNVAWQCTCYRCFIG